MTLKDPEYQERILARLVYYDTKSRLELIKDIQDELYSQEYLDEFAVRLCLMISNMPSGSVNVTTIPDALSLTLLKQYSDKTRLPTRLVIYQLLK